MFKNKIKISLAIIVFVFTSCFNQEKKQANSLQNLSKEDRFEISQNSLKKALEKEEIQIEAYIKRKGGEFIKTKTGVRILVTKKQVSSEKAKAGNIIQITYSLNLLNGTVIKKAGTKERFVLEYSEKESGLHEAIKSINLNEEAIVIIPSHRAHGLVGNDKNIPALSTLVYQLKLISIE